jgi:hypothetical protein
MPYTAEILASSIIVVGNFNPAIFSPDWLEKNGLIGNEDAEVARDGSEGTQMIVSKQVTTFETGWFSLQVLDNRLALTSKGALSPAFKDLAVGILQLVPHTPVVAVGLNFLAHFKLNSEDAYHLVGDVLAPKTIWDTLYPGCMVGLAELTIAIQQGVRGKPPETNDAKRITVQPSTKIKHGIHMSYNDHHDVQTADDRTRPAERVAEIIDDQWELSWQDAVRAFDTVLSMTLNKAG